jgi:hypothetical protein
MRSRPRPCWCFTTAASRETRTNIDHLAVTAPGIYVIDAQRYRGRRPALKVEGGFLRPLAVMHDVVGDELPVHGVLCFVDADWPLIGGPITVRGVNVLSPRKLCSVLRANGPLATEVLAATHQRVAAALPPA